MLDIGAVVKEASSRRGSPTSEEGRHLHPDDLQQMYGSKSRSPSPNKAFMGGGPHRYQIIPLTLSLCDKKKMLINNYKLIYENNIFIYFNKSNDILKLKLFYIKLIS